MRVLMIGNSGSGKSIFAARLEQGHRLAHLDLDPIVWEPGMAAVQRAQEDIARSLDAFLALECGIHRPVDWQCALQR